jgi:hypothetical protein
MFTTPRCTVLSVVVVLVGVVGAMSSVGTATANARRLPTRTIEAGEVTVELTPTRVDEDVAIVEIVLDTHSTELDMNLRRASSLTVDRVTWPTTRYRGDGPGGHHREGTLRFRAAGPPDGELELRVRGLPERIVATWQL